ncbi:MAG: Transcription regulator, TetR-like [Frankiales bacterium]|nr:Transcription regulator, TetR-like [Frankiales bacterium]
MRYRRGVTNSDADGVSRGAPATARARARIELTAAILDAARRQMAESGAAAVSLRAVARDLGMASSAVYRYVASRDELLTRLIIDAFNALGERAEQASAAALAQGAAPGERWLEVARSFRAWSTSHPHEHALVFGTPVPGYAAPQDTVAPAMRIPIVLADVLVEAAATGQLQPPSRSLPQPTVVSADTIALAGRPPAPYDDLLERALLVWTSLIGTVSSELFGHIKGGITDEARFFDLCVVMTAEIAGLQVVLPSEV